MSSHTTLEAATQDRKSRLAQLKSLKRKQPEPSNDEDTSTAISQTTGSAEEADVTRTYLSGRNYDPETRGPKLGFEAAPNDGQETLETQAAVLVDLTRKADQDHEVNKEVEVDLFKLQPKKPNWDLKRELKERMELLGVRTDNAIARLVRERLEGQKRDTANGDDVVPMEGSELLEVVHMRERQEVEEEKREREIDEAA
jgi:coiled-coil domain-containing protein 12